MKTAQTNPQFKVEISILLSNHKIHRQRDIGDSAPSTNLS